MEIRPGSQGAPIPSSETTSYSAQRSPYPHNLAEFVNNAGPVGPRGSPQTLPSISSSKSNLPDHSYYSGVPKLTQSSAPLPMEQTGPPRYAFEKPAMDLESYRGNSAYNQATFPDSVNGLKDTRDGYSSREYNNYPKYPPVQREYLPYERERDTSYEYTRHGKNELTYPRHPNSGISESAHHWNPADSAWSHDGFPPRYPPSSRSYSDHRNYPAGGATDRGVSIHKREEYLESSLQRNPSFSDHERKIEVKTEEPLSEHRVKSSSPLALDKVVENCRRLSHFAFEYGNRSDRVYPYPSDSLVKEMAAKAQDILHVLTSLGSESIKSGNRNEQALGDEDMEYIRNKRTLLAPSRPKYRKRSRSGQPPPGRCHSCNTTETPEWRRGPDGARTLCNACGLHFAKLTRKRALVAAAATANDTADSENGDKEPSRRSDGDSRKDNESVKSSDA